MFSLCIPTMDRFDSFLINYLPKYLNNNLISEIIITDENGNDFNKINQTFQNNKIKVFKNENRLGPFLNKLKCCRLATNEWIVLMDSDNFADYDYFYTASNYIQSHSLSKETILAPSFAKPNFNYTSLQNSIINKNNIKSILQYDKLNKNCFPTLMNTGNYIINKFLIENINLSNETENIKMSSACDVIYINTLFFEQFDLHFHVLENLHYSHVVHPESIYLLTHRQYPHFNHYVHERFYNLCN